jgi:cyclopropane-fatty-acyl-phospholipid synthase
MPKVPPFFVFAMKRIVKEGRFTAIDAYGRVHQIGPAAKSECTVRLTDPWLHILLLVEPQMHLGKAYMEGTLILDEGVVDDLLELLQRNLGTGFGPAIHKFLHALRWLVKSISQWNPIRRSRRNVEHHYDVPDIVYQAFLDEDRQYSCAYFMTPNDTLELAQEQKKRHIASKLMLGPNQHVLDIGSGWGGLGLYLSQVSGARVTGVTLSANQLELSRQRARDAGLEETVEFRSQDYRRVSGAFDRIVSVGMLEHVGAPHLQTYFDKINELLTDNGVALIHTIGRSDGPGVTNPWIDKYIFPGGYAPSLGELMPLIEEAGLILTDVEVWRLHYAHTLRQWRERFKAKQVELEPEVGANFIRMWEFYLAASEMAFRYQGNVVFQLQLTKAVDALPITRDYMLDWEREETASLLNGRQAITAAVSSL